ncbi:MAG: DUF1211 domain-containing protein [Actinomycetia bacterium]|nr:DUF1211 domain-containing protein [Actinomycetes bacterium]
MATNRVESLTDGVYAIAMTILILNLRVPAVPGHPRVLLRALAGLQLQFFDFFISFFCLRYFGLFITDNFTILSGLTTICFG